MLKLSDMNMDKTNKPIFLLLGGNKLNYGILNKFKQKGFNVFVIDWNQHPQMTGDRHYQIDIKDCESIIKALKKDSVWNQVTFAYSSIDVAVPSVAKINRAIGLKTISDEGLKFSSSKSRMTNKWAEYGLLNRISRSYSAYASEIYDLNQKMTLIIKPDNSASSRGITIIDRQTSENTIQNAFEKAMKEATDGIVVVEEFVEGTEFTVEMIGDSYGNVCVFGISKKTHTNNTDNNRIAVKLHYNSVDDALQEKIARFGINCYKALHFSSSLGHLEVILKKDGNISPVEIGARSSGNIASDLVDIVSGVSFLDELICVQQGKMLQNGFYKQTSKSSMYYFYDFPAGTTIKKEATILDYCDASISSRFYDRRFLSVGTKFNKINSDNDRYGYEILEGPKDIMTEEYIASAEHRMMEDILY